MEQYIKYQYSPGHFRLQILNSKAGLDMFWGKSYNPCLSFFCFGLVDITISYLPRYGE